MVLGGGSWSGQEGGTLMNDLAGLLKEFPGNSRSPIAGGQLRSRVGVCEHWVFSAAAGLMGTLLSSPLPGL